MDDNWNHPTIQHLSLPAELPPTGWVDVVSIDVNLAPNAWLHSRQSTPPTQSWSQSASRQHHLTQWYDWRMWSDRVMFHQAGLKACLGTLLLWLLWWKSVSYMCQTTHRSNAKCKLQQIAYFEYAYVYFAHIVLHMKTVSPSLSLHYLCRNWMIIVVHAKLFAIYEYISKWKSW